MSEPKNLSRFAHIDTLRGLAALYVFFYHLALLPNPDLVVPLWAKRVVHAGGTGVTLFFVVSAFTLCYSLRGRSDGAHPIYDFYVRRLFRIVPLFYVWVVISLMRDGYLFGKTQSFGDILLSTFFVFNLIPGKETGFVWASWTLGVEMLFYLIFPLVFRLITDYRRALALFLFMVVVSKAFQGFVAYLALSEEQSKSFYHFSFLHQLPIFAIGVLVFYLYESFIEDKNVDRVWGVVLLAAFVFIYDAILSGNLQNVVLEGLYWQAVAYGCLLLGLSIFPWKVIVNRFTMFLGLISYSVYLSHTTIIVAFAFLYSRIYSLGMSTSLKFLVSALITLSVIILISYVSYRLIEEPGMRLGRWLIRRRTLSSYPADPVGETGTKVA
jgi:peptidoglycan/LPS O-acetylase OafA/YrhL